MTTDSLASTYVITAASAGGLHQQTRRLAVGAFALVRSWEELGYTAITVRDRADCLLQPEAL